MCTVVVAREPEPGRRAIGDHEDFGVSYGDVESGHWAQWKGWKRRRVTVQVEDALEADKYIFGEHEMRDDCVYQVVPALREDQRAEVVERDGVGRRLSTISKAHRVEETVDMERGELWRIGKEVKDIEWMTQRGQSVEGE